ncbi:alpha/beta hydrolase, partial [Rhodothermus marinus]|uniref:alpha/beta hydrolase n=1 Tax=Rhodothermus marinus TaxID=29549 RepID=UPI0023428C14
AEEDGRQAIRFVRQRAAEWGIDPRKIGIIGFSAGGHVAVATALEHDARVGPTSSPPSIRATAWRRCRRMPRRSFWPRPTTTSWLDPSRWRVSMRPGIGRADPSSCTSSPPAITGSERFVRTCLRMRGPSCFATGSAI